MSSTTSGTNALPFSARKQNAMVGHMLTNEKFFKQCKDTISAEWFNDPFTNRLYKVMLAFHSRYGRWWNSLVDFKGSQCWMQEDNKTRIRLEQQVDDCQAETANFQLEILSVELTEWLHSRMYIEGMQKSSEYFNEGKFELSYKTARDTVEHIDRVTFGGDINESFLNYRADFERAENILTGANLCTMGLPAFDRCLLPDANGSGSLQPGDTTLLLAPTNVGKTTTMITILMYNLLLKKRVLFITHEGRPQDIKEKLWMNFMRMTRKELFTAYKSTDPIVQQKFQWAAQFLETNLTYLPMNKAGLTVEEVERIIRRRQEMLVASSSDGRGFDLVVIDYPSKLSTTLAQKGQLARRQIDDVVYNRFVQLALEYSFHVVSAIQTNREGSKANKGRGDGRKRLVHMEDVSEAWGPMTTATNVISINRDDEAMAANTVTFLICKSRSSETGWAILCRSRYDIARTHNEKDGATIYRASSAEHVNAELLLKNYSGKEVPSYALQFKEDSSD